MDVSRQKNDFLLYGRATFRRVLMTSQSEETGHFGSVKLLLQNVSLATASEDTIIDGLF